MDSIRATITIPKEFLEDTKELDKKKGMSLSGFIRFAVSELKRKEEIEMKKGE